VIQKAYVVIDGRPMCRVTFTLPQSMWAVDVSLVGDFNGWQRKVTPLTRVRDGEWSVTVNLEVGRAYQMRYLVDNERWLNDPGADAYVSNPFGSDNFVVVTDPDFLKYDGEGRNG
jgi:1,4-alpha-glucan branching enzyme